MLEGDGVGYVHEYFEIAPLGRGHGERPRTYTVAVRTWRPPSAAAVLLAERSSPVLPRIATAIAGGDFSLYCFEGLLKHRPHYHITSTLISHEPHCVTLVDESDTVLTVHGL